MQNSSLLKIAHPITFLSIAGFIFAKLFLIMHYPFGMEIMLVSTLTVVVSYPFLYFSKRNKTLYDHISIGGIVILFLGLLNVVFKMGVFYMFYSYNTIAFFMIIFAVSRSLMMKQPSQQLMEDDYEFGKEEDLDNARSISEESQPSKLPIYMFYIFIPIVLLGMLFKIQHYPGASVLTLVGFVGSAISVLLLAFRKR